MQDADRVRADLLAEPIRAIRTMGMSDAEIEARVNAIAAAERERAANASVLAELLAPMLAAALPTGQPAPAHAPGSRSAAVAPASAAAPRSRPADIADFIDDMIALERPPAPVRRAS